MTSEVKSGINRPTNVNVMRRLDGLAGKVGPNDTVLSDTCRIDPENGKGDDAVNDVSALREVLGRSYGFPEKSIVVLTSQQEWTGA